MSFPRAELAILRAARRAEDVAEFAARWGGAPAAAEVAGRAAAFAWLAAEALYESEMLSGPEHQGRLEAVRTHCLAQCEALDAFAFPGPVWSTERELQYLNGARL